MTVRKRGKKWTARLYKGQGRYEWVGTFETEDEAWEAYREAKRIGTRGQETCAAFADRWLRDYNHSSKDGRPRWGQKTKADYRQMLGVFCQEFGELRLRDFDPALARPWAARQPAKYVAVTRTMFADAVRDGLVATNPFANLRLPRSEGRRHIAVLSEPEVEQLLDIASGMHGDYGPVFAAALSVLAYSGIRPGELAALEPRDVDLDRGELCVRRAFSEAELKPPKNWQPRLGIVLPPPALVRLRAMQRPIWPAIRLGDEEVNPLFRTVRGARLRKTSMHYYWRPVASALEAQLPDERATELRESRRGEFTVYELRHAAASFLLDRGVSPEDVAWQLGHTDGGALVRRLYGHPNDALRRERLKRAYEQNVRELRSVDGKEAASG